ncbi:MAG: hypothetical protein CMH44_10465 [Muricauda sp.]|nr:hypothetical protein [Allomuricauda sp.]
MDIIDKNDIDDFLVRKQVNVLICSSSFERRCFAVVDQINTAKFDELLVFRVADLNHRIIINSELFGSKLSVNTSSYVNVNINDITSSFFEIRASLKRIFSGPKSVVTVDITGNAGHSIPPSLG